MLSESAHHTPCLGSQHSDIFMCLIPKATYVTVFNFLRANWVSKNTMNQDIVWILQEYYKTVLHVKVIE